MKFSITMRVGFAEQLRWWLDDSGPDPPATRVVVTTSKDWGATLGEVSKQV